jgi:hypothetical protein
VTRIDYLCIIPLATSSITLLQFQCQIPRPYRLHYFGNPPIRMNCPIYNVNYMMIPPSPIGACYHSMIAIYSYQAAHNQFPTFFEDPNQQASSDNKPFYLVKVLQQDSSTTP